MRLAAAALAALAALLIVPLGGSTTAPNVVGVLIRPAAAGCSREEPCDPPPLAPGLVFTSGGRVVARVHVGAGGRFATHLAPGRYGVRAIPIFASQKLSPSSFRVPVRGVVHLRLVVG
jgi:hypothetical protein